MWPSPAAAVSTRSFWPSFRPPSRARPSTAGHLDVVGRRAELAQDRPDGLALFGNDECSLQSLAGSGLGQQRDVLGHHARFEPDIGIGFALGGVAELEVVRPVAASALANSGEVASALLATSRTRATTSSSGKNVEGLTRGSNELRSHTAASLAFGAGGRKSQVTKETSASGSAAGGASSTLATPSVNSFCGLNGGMLAETSETDSDRLPETRTKDRVRTKSRSRTRVVMGTRTIWRATLISLSAASRSVLRMPLRWPPRCPASAPRNRHLDSLRRRGEIGFAVERSKNGAAHQRGAAQSGQDGAAEPLDDSRRRSIRPPVPPSAESGGSLPRLIVSASNLRFAPRSFIWSKTTVPRTRDHARPAPRLPEFVKSPADSVWPDSGLRKNNAGASPDPSARRPGV
jgi:hypothetical protein